MKTTITHELIRETKRQLQNGWHTAEWHKFMARPDVEEICLALHFNQLDRLELTDAQIRAQAIARMEEKRLEAE